MVEPVDTAWDIAPETAYWQQFRPRCALCGRPTNFRHPSVMGYLDTECVRASEDAIMAAEYGAKGEHASALMHLTKTHWNVHKYAERPLLSANLTAISLYAHAISEDPLWHALPETKIQT